MTDTAPEMHQKSSSQLRLRWPDFRTLKPTLLALLAAILGVSSIALDIFLFPETNETLIDRAPEYSFQIDSLTHQLFTSAESLKISHSKVSLESGEKTVNSNFIESLYLYQNDLLSVMRSVEAIGRVAANVSLDATKMTKGFANLSPEDRATFDQFIALGQELQSRRDAWRNFAEELEASLYSAPADDHDLAKAMVQQANTILDIYGGKGLFLKQGDAALQFVHKFRLSSMDTLPAYRRAFEAEMISREFRSSIKDYVSVILAVLSALAGFGLFIRTEAETSAAPPAA